MGGRRLLVVLVSMLALAATTAPAGAATPSLKAQFAPLNTQIKKIGTDIGTSINGAAKAATFALVKDSKPIALARTKLAKALGVPV